MNIRLTVDRFEGDAKEVAVLVDDHGVEVNFRKALLPKGARAGDDTTARVAARTRKVQDELKKPIPAGRSAMRVRTGPL